MKNKNYIFYLFTHIQCVLMTHAGTTRIVRKQNVFQALCHHHRWLYVPTYTSLEYYYFSIEIDFCCKRVMKLFDVLARLIP